MQIGDLLDELGARASFDKAAGWDPVGLQIGDAARTVELAAVCHDVTDTVVEGCVRHQPQLLVTYHPLLFRSTRHLLAGASPAGRALRLIEAGVAVAAVHTNWDAASGGTADALAAALELEGVAGFGPLWGGDSAKIVTFVPAQHAEAVAGAMAAAGAGRIGNYSGCSFRLDGVGTFLPGSGTTPYAGRKGHAAAEPETRIEMNAPKSLVDGVVAALVASHPYEEPAYDVYERRGDAGFVGRHGHPPPGTTLRDVADLVAERLGGALRVAGEPGREVSRVAVVPGSGSSFLAAAAATRSDCLVTGDVAHHRALTAADCGMAVVDPGHVPTERPGVKALGTAIADISGDCLFLTTEDSPWWETPWKS